MGFVQKMLATRSGTIALGAGAAVIAAFLLLVYLNQYRSSVASDSEPVTVLVAKSLIERGMPGDIVGIRKLFDSEDTPKNQVQDGAITDPATLRGRIATEDIYPGQQLTVADFATSTGAIGASLAGKNRAIAIPVDAAHGMIGTVESGDRVDVFASLQVRGATGAMGRPVLKILAQNALVLDAPTQTAAGVGAANQSASVVLRVTRNQAAEMAFAVDNGKLWIVLRPRAGAPPTMPGAVTDESVLAGIRPEVVYRRIRGQIGGRR